MFEGKTLEIFSKLPFWVTCAVWICALTILLGKQFEWPHFEAVTPIVVQAAIVSGLLAFCLTVTRLISIGVSAAQRPRKNRRVKIKFARLSQSQQQLLLEVYSKGSRSFHLPSETAAAYWIEELIEAHWIDVPPALVYISNTDVLLAVPQYAWRQLQKIANTGSGI